jgi:hypothetical protein
MMNTSPYLNIIKNRHIELHTDEPTKYPYEVRILKDGVPTGEVVVINNFDEENKLIKEIREKLKKEKKKVWKKPKVIYRIHLKWWKRLEDDEESWIDENRFYEDIPKDEICLRAEQHRGWL